ncbi:MAG: hypothetical protein AB7O24_01885 [Kofleriaceae bacterium]
MSGAEPSLGTLRFEADALLAARAEDLANAAVEMTAPAVSPPLDYSEASIEILDEILDEIHHDRANLDEHRAFQLGAVFGSYLGEVLRRAYSAEWGQITGSDGAPFPGLRLTNGAVIWPWARAQQRFLDGAENSVSTYYRYLTKDLSAAS